MGFLKAVVNQKLQGQDVLNILCFSGSGAELVNAQILTDYIQQAYQDEFSVRQADEYSWDSITWYDAEAPSGTPGLNILPTGGGHVGVSTAAPLPNNVAGLLAFQSIVGPPWRGRMYVGGFTVDVMNQNGTLSPNTIQSLNTFGAKLAAIGATTGVVATHSIIGSNKALPIQDRTAIVSSYIGRAIPANQRRRTLNVGS